MNRALAEGTKVVRFVWTHPEVRGRRLSAIVRLVAWQCWQRTVRRPWTVTLVDGIRIKCYPHSNIGSAALYCRYGEWREMRFLLDVLRPGDCFVDVGANIGVYSLLACSIPGVMAWAFEPASVAAARASENIRMNDLEDRIHLERMGVGATAGSGYITTDSDAMNRLTSTASPASEPVIVVTLDSVLPEDVCGAVSVVKIDVEGHELAVLAGAERLLDIQRPIFIVEENDRESLERLFTARGYRRYTYDPDAGALTAPGPDVLNGIYISDSSPLRARLRPSATASC